MRNKAWNGLTRSSVDFAVAVGRGPVVDVVAVVDVVVVSPAEWT